MFAPHFRLELQNSTCPAIENQKSKIKNSPTPTPFPSDVHYRLPRHAPRAHGDLCLRSVSSLSRDSAPPSSGPLFVPESVPNENARSERSDQCREHGDTPARPAPDHLPLPQSPPATVGPRSATEPLSNTFPTSAGPWRFPHTPAEHEHTAIATVRGHSGFQCVRSCVPLPRSFVPRSCVRCGSTSSSRTVTH